MLRTTGFLMLLLCAAVGAEPMSLEDVARVKAVTSVAVSPNGSHVAFVKRVPRRPPDEVDYSAFLEEEETEAATE